MWCSIFWGFVFLICITCYTYLDFNNLRKLGVFSQESKFTEWAVYFILLFIVFFPVYLRERFKKIKCFKEAGGDLNDAVVYFNVGYILFFVILLPIILAFGCISHAILESAPQ